MTGACENRFLVNLVVPIKRLPAGAYLHQRDVPIASSSVNPAQGVMGQVDCTLGKCGRGNVEIDAPSRHYTIHDGADIPHVRPGENVSGPL